jgi:hypothetical protein
MTIRTRISLLILIYQNIIWTGLSPPFMGALSEGVFLFDASARVNVFVFGTHRRFYWLLFDLSCLVEVG